MALDCLDEGFQPSHNSRVIVCCNDCSFFSDRKSVLFFLYLQRTPEGRIHHFYLNRVLSILVWIHLRRNMVIMACKAFVLLMFNKLVKVSARVADNVRDQAWLEWHLIMLGVLIHVDILGIGHKRELISLKSFLFFSDQLV